MRASFRKMMVSVAGCLCEGSLDQACFRGMMKAFFQPRSVAVAGASKTLWKLGNVPLANMQKFGYKGRIIPLNPEGGEILGLKAYPSIEDVEGGVDLAVAVIPREGVISFLESCGRAGTRNVLITAAGFADAAGDGPALQREVTALAKRLGIRIMGPNSIGTIDTASGLVTSIISLEPIAPGPVSYVTQSGLFSAGFARWMASGDSCGASKIACLGNKADINEIDLLSYLLDDASTEVIALHTEGTKDGREFIRVATGVSLSKPLIVLSPGRTEAGQAAAMSHTGSLACSFEVFRGALAQAGAVTVDSFEEMFDCSRALAWCPLPRGAGVGVVSVTGAGCSLTADACSSNGLVVPPLAPDTHAALTRGMPDWASFSNPADIWAAIMSEGNEGAYRKLMRAMASQDDVDILLAIYCVAPQFEFDVAGVTEEIAAEFPHKPILSVLLGGTLDDSRRWSLSLEGVRAPAFDSVERAVKTAAGLNRYASWLRMKGAGPQAAR